MSALATPMLAGADSAVEAGAVGTAPAMLGFVTVVWFCEVVVEPFVVWAVLGGLVVELVDRVLEDPETGGVPGTGVPVGTVQPCVLLLPRVGREPSGHWRVTVVVEVDGVDEDVDVELAPVNPAVVTALTLGVVVSWADRNETSRLTPWRFPKALVMGAALKPDIAAS
jgi:hypothetical protein